MFGASAFAASATLAAFMAGLGVGGYLGGRWAARVRSPLGWYAWLELAIVPAVACVDGLLASANPLLTHAYAAGLGLPALNALRATLALLVLLPPTLVMGATLPMLAQAVVRSPARLARPLGHLYACNTFGAALGALAAGFVMLEMFGLSGTRQIAMATNALIGVIALIASMHVRQEPAWAGAPDSPPEPRGSVVLAYAISGAAALVLEVVWTRTLILYAGSTTYAFTTMLALVLVGIATGSLLAGRLVDRLVRLHAWLGGVLAAIAVTSVAGFLLLSRVAPPLERWIVPVPSFGRLLLVTMAIASVAILLPAVGFGAVFPIVGRHEVRGATSPGFATGRAYAANLLGAVAGAYVSGFVLIPWLGLYGTLLLVAVVLTGTAAVLWQMEPVRLPGRARVSGAGGLAVLACAPLLLPAIAPHHPPGPGESLIYYAEGASATVSVLQDQTGSKTLFVDRMSVAGTDPVMQTDQKSLAHIPMLLHPAPRRILTVGFGSGGASWSYTRYPMLERADCVEIAPEVVDAAPHLREANHRLFDDPRYRVIFDDARAYLRHTPERYDIIATDCTDLRYKGNATLYTKEYFGLCRLRLQPRGLVVVWMPLGGLSDELFRMALRTFAEALPHVSVWYLNNYPTHYVLLVGSETPHALDWETLLERIDIPDVRSDLASIQLDDPFRLASTFLLDDAAVREFVGGGAINSDERPLLELRAPRTAGLFTGADNLRALVAQAGDRSRVPLRVGFGERQRQTVEARLEPYLRAARLVNGGHVSYQSGQRDFSAAIASYRRAAMVNPSDPYLPSLIRSTERTRDITRAAYRAAAETPDAPPGALHNYGLSLLDGDQPDQAVPVFQRLVALRPGLAEAHLDLARAARLAGRPSEARAAAERAAALAPDRANAHFELGQVRLAARDLPGALESFRQAVRLEPALAEAHFNAGNVLAELGRLDEARQAYDAGLAGQPEQAAARVNLAQIWLLLGNRAAARAELERAMAAPGAVSEKARALLATLEAGAPGR